MAPAGYDVSGFDQRVFPIDYCLALLGFNIVINRY